MDCDVFYMDACHVLFGRPWQFDKDVVHQGKGNTCSFTWNNKKIVLVPQQEKREGSSSNTHPTLFVTNLIEIEIHKELKSKATSLILLVKETVDRNHPLSVPLQSLLEEFKDISLEELPKGLPPLRNIKH